MSRAPTIALIAFGGLAAVGVAASQFDLSFLRALIRESAAPEKVAVSKASVSPTTAKVSTLATLEGLTAGKDSIVAAEKSVATFDVARIDPDGASVFAGRAAPNAAVTVIANGHVVATVNADGSGEWSAVTDKRIASGPNQLAIVVKANDADPARQGQSVNIDVAAGKRLAVPSDMLATGSIPARSGKGDIRLASANPDGLTLSSGARKPQPVTFVFREATMTDEGRRAAGALADFLRQQKLDAVTLSGHADERGTEETNLELSRQRLEAVASVLRKSGYNGKLDLVAKGKAEP